jgi:hypothetical protein
MALEPMKPYSQSLAKYIPEQYKQSARLRGVIEAVQGQFDDLEDAFMEIYQALDPREAIGVALDYIGAIVGVDREPAEDDESYRVRIITRSFLDAGLPTPETVRAIIKYMTGSRSVGLFPDWPAAMYYVLDGGTQADLSTVEKEIMTSGASLTRGTFLVGELEGTGYEFGYIVDEDHGMPIVCDYRWPEYDLITSDGDDLVDDEQDNLMAVDALIGV